MRLIKKSCPNCGAGLKFDKHDTEVTCEYCKQSFMIEDREIGERIEIDPNVISNVSDDAKAGLVAFGAFSIVSGITFFIFFLLIVGVMIFGMITFRNHFFPKDEVVEKQDDSFNLDYRKSADYITDFSQLTDEAIITMTKESMDRLTEKSTFYGNSSDTWGFVGRYLLTTKEDRLLNVNYIYEVYKVEYTKKDGSKRIAYAAVRFADIMKLHGELVIPTHSIVVHCPSVLEAGTVGFLYGYDSIEALYNGTIKDNASSYNIKATDGMFLG